MCEEYPSPSARWAQLLLLMVLTAFVGAMWGLEHSIVPLIAEQDFGITSATITLSFIIGFGLTKVFANILAGVFMDRVGRRRILILGWIIGLPVPLLIIWAPNWEWIIAANLLLGINQGLCWTATILMMQDLLGSERRGLATGLNEFIGYSGVAITALATGFLAATFALRPQPFFLGIGLAIIGLILSALLVRDTIQYAQKEAAPQAESSGLQSFWETFVTSLRSLTLLSCNQAGLVTKINHATVWGLFPIFLRSQELDTAKIGLIVAIYPLIWGLTQLGTGILSDYVGRKPLIVGGMLLQAFGISLAASTWGFPVWIGSAILLGIGTAAVYPTLIAAVGDSSPPLRRASAIGMYRGWRDCGFVVGGLILGLLKDTTGFHITFLVIAGCNVISGLIVAALMTETSKNNVLGKGVGANRHAPQRGRDFF